MNLDPHVLSPQAYETIQRDLAHRKETVRLERQRLQREAKALAFPAVVEGNDGARSRLSGVTRTIGELGQEEVILADALEEAAARRDRYSPAHAALAQLAAIFHALGVEIDLAVRGFANRLPSDVSPADSRRYGEASQEATALWSTLMRLTRDRQVFPFDECSAAERLRYNGSTTCKALANQLPSLTAPARWPWMDLVDLIEGKQATVAALVGAGDEEDTV